MMFRNLKFKYKIITLPLLAVIALLLLLFVTQFFGRKNRTLSTQLEAGFAPALEVGYDLEKTLTDIQRSMQDAVAAADEEEFEQTNVLAEKFLQLLDKGSQNSFFKAESLQVLSFEFQQYYELARATSQHLIEGKSLEKEIVSDLQAMSEQYNSLREHVKVEANQAKERVALLFEMTLENNNKSTIAINIIIVCCTLLLGGISIFLIRSTTTPLRNTIHVANQFAEGKNHVRILVNSTDEIGELGNALNTMMEKIEKQDWLKTGQTTLNEYMRGEQQIVTLSQNIITYLSRYLDVQIGAIYLNDDNDHALKLAGSYAFTQRKGNRNTFKPGEGLVGQAALEKQSILFTDIPDDYIKINSGLGEITPRNVFVIPFLYEDAIKGVIELGSAHRFTEAQMDFLNQICESIAIAIHSAQSRVKMQELLTETQRQSEVLQKQQEDLRQANDELEKQTESLKISEERLRAQQEELRQTNEELEGQARLLEHQKQELGEKNTELKKAQELLEKRAKDLELTSKYKSEFLANMSHELRTPLNSLLILSKLLIENKEGNLTEKQLEFASTIYNAGFDLLNLINEVLDLSKVEAGKMILNIETMSLKGLSTYVKQHFTHIIEEKGLELKIELEEGLPASIRTDRQRVEQILKNLLSNAVKFTEEGEVSVHIDRPNANVLLLNDGLTPQNAVAISVSDTGIGIPEEKQKLIFEAFQQADGTTNRKYGGTGLGLSITRELIKLLGGEIQLQSEEGKGSRFTLFLPEEIQAVKVEQQAESDPSSLISVPRRSTSSSEIDAIWDDRHDTISPEDKFLLVIEDDARFAKILFDLAREKGFKGLIAGDGSAGLQLAYQYKPSAIILDIGLPGMDGWVVMEKLKKNPETRHIPVHFISAYDQPLDAKKMGAIGHLTKPVTMEDLHHAFQAIEKSISRTIKKLLIVEDDESTRLSMLELLGGKDVDIMTVETGEEAHRLLSDDEFDCMVLDLGLADISGFELLETIKTDVMASYLPIIVYTARELTKDEELRLKKHAESIVIKGARSQERLVDEVTLFLHRIEANLPEAQQKKLRMIHDKEEVLNGKIILMVDDDIRNVFALSSILEGQGMSVLVGENGKEALELLEQNPEIDLVLMDIMMPEMDGYEAMEQIKNQPRFSKIPIIALTAKAMKGDRQKCIDAGANDYLAKPVDTGKLLSLLRVWLY